MITLIKHQTWKLSERLKGNITSRISEGNQRAIPRLLWKQVKVVRGHRKTSEGQWSIYSPFIPPRLQSRHIVHLFIPSNSIEDQHSYSSIFIKFSAHKATEAPKAFICLYQTIKSGDPLIASKRRIRISVGPGRIRNTKRARLHFHRVGIAPKATFKTVKARQILRVALNNLVCSRGKSEEARQTTRNKFRRVRLKSDRLLYSGSPRP